MRSQRHADTNGGSVYPSIALLTLETGLHYRTVRRQIAELEAEDWIQVGSAGIGGQGWKRYLYTLTIPKGGGTVSGRSAEKVGAQCPDVNEEGGGTTTPPQTPDVGAPLPRLDARRGGTVSKNVGAQCPLRTSIEDDHTYTSDFEKFWTAYPTRLGTNSKKAAFRKWKATLKSRATAEILIGAAQRYSAFCEAEDIVGTRFIKLASTFLGQDEHWCEFQADPLNGSDPMGSAVKDLRAEVEAMERA